MFELPVARRRFTPRRAVQLSLFARYPAVTVLPTLSEPIALGAAPQWCDECGEERDIQWDDHRDEWICEHYTHCDECGWFESNHCETCDKCEDCCTCHYCNECSEMVADDEFCGSCDQCNDHCSCYRCDQCDRTYSDADEANACINCYQCGRCCSGCGEDYESDNDCSCEDCSGGSIGSYNVPRSGRYVGIEVEFGGSMDSARRALRESGLRGWQIKYDGSVGDGGEMTSPPLNWDDVNAQEQLHAAMAALRSAGCTPIVQAGIHVHVNAKDLSAKQRAAVALWGYDYEDIFVRLASSGWQTLRRGAATYAQKISDVYASRLARVESENDLNTAVWAEGRYRVVNLEAFEEHGTVEFRAFNSSTSAARVAAYVSVCLAVVQSVREGKTPKPQKRYALGEMADGINSSLHCRSVLLASLAPWFSTTDVHRICEAWEDSHAQGRYAA